MTERDQCRPRLTIISCLSRVPRVLFVSCLGRWEAEAGVADASLRVRICEHWYSRVDVVVDLDARLLRVGADDASDVLHDAPFELHREDEEGSIERRTVESFADVRTNGNDQQRGPSGVTLRESIAARLAVAPSLPWSDTGESPTSWSR